jgi:hypothetical protein
MKRTSRCHFFEQWADRVLTAATLAGVLDEPA